MTGAPPRHTHDYVAECGPVRIRRKVVADAVDDYAWRRDPETARLNAQSVLDMSFAEYVRRVDLEIRFPDPARASFSVETRDGTHVGNIMYYNGDGESAELGISIGPSDQRGLGLGTAAVIAFVRFAWETAPLRRLYLHTLEWNERAQRCFARAGFEPTARVHRRGEWFVRMEARREWWLLWDMEGRFVFPARACGEDGRTPGTPDS